MIVSDVCKSYFNGFYEVSNYKNNDYTTTALAALKIFSYISIIIPVGVGFVYGAASLYGRVTQNEQLPLPIAENAKRVNKKRPFSCSRNRPVTKKRPAPRPQKDERVTKKEPLPRPQDRRATQTKPLSRPQKDKPVTKKEPLPRPQDKPVTKKEPLATQYQSTVDISILQKKAVTFVLGYRQSKPLSAYIQKVLADPAFQANPQLFMDSWEEKRGQTEELRFPEDEARFFFQRELYLQGPLPQSLVGRAYNTKPLDNVGINKLQKRAVIYVKECINLKDNPSEVLACIQDVLANPAFQNNPRLFMDLWEKKRGILADEEFRPVADNAMLFFLREQI